MTELKTTNQRLAELILEQTYDERMILAAMLFDYQDALEEDPTANDFANWLGEWARANVGE